MNQIKSIFQLIFPINIITRKKKNETLQEQKIMNIRKTNEENRDKIRAYMKEYDKNPDNIRKKFIRDLTKGELKWDKMRDSTKNKYNLNYDSVNNRYY